MFLNDWKESGIDGMREDFGLKESDLDGVEVLLASYTYEDYYGSAFVLFRKDGRLFEVNGSHCSCYGLSERSYCVDGQTQWQPEETTVEALLHRLEHDTYQFDGMRDELHQVLGDLMKK